MGLFAGYRGPDTITAAFEVRNARLNANELEKTCPRNIHCSRYASPNVSSAKRRRAARSIFSAVSLDGWSVGDFCAAICETEINPSAGQCSGNFLGVGSKIPPR